MALQTRPTRFLLVGVAALFSASAADASAFRTAPSSGPPTAAVPRAQAVLGVGVARYRAFDRFVLTFSGTGTPGYRVSYVTRVREDGSGFVVPMRGRYALQVQLEPATARRYPYRWRREVNLPVLRQLRTAGDFEGVATFAAGLDSRKGYRVTLLTKPPRIAIDVRR